MATVGFRGASDHDGVNAYIAHMPGVKKAVRAKGREIQGRAEALFAAHNRPGGHEITGERRDTDYLVSLVGPAPLSVEFGRGPFTRDDGVHVGPMEGLHILGRAAGL